jgi:hypothetical protein
MRVRNIPWKMVLITFGLAATAVLMNVITFIYAEGTKDPDAIEAPVFFLSLGILMLAFLMVPATIAVWMFNSRRIEKG